MIGMCNSNPRNIQNTVLIHDSRPFQNAVANRAKGGGYEECGPGNNYPSCKIKFADIDNIHAVTACYKNMFKLAYNANEPKDAQAYLLELDKSGYRQML